MKNMRLFEALGKIDENLIEEASPENTENKNYKYVRLGKRVAVAASVCLLIAGAIDTLGRLDYTFEANCGAFLGEIVEGTYYYFEPHKGIMKYTPEGEPELLLHTYWIGEDWEVTEYGIYYRDGMSVYVCDHETGTRTKLYTADSVENTHMRFKLWTDNKILVTNYNKNTQIVYEVLVDGISGGEIETVMEKTSYQVANNVYYGDMHLWVGDREIILEPQDEKRQVFIAKENGVNILPEGFYVTRHYQDAYENVLLLHKHNDENYKTVFAIYPDGTNQVIQMPPYGNYSGDDKFLYHAEPLEDGIACVDARTGESWFLRIEANGMKYKEMHNVESNGEYMYTCGPAGGETALWKLVYDDNGKPIGMYLIDNDISNQ